ncbi:MAG TPA: hypothetical protein VN932_04510 [Rhizomicrobium sp.]|nr:hypothetical protein [Rhizomicrobium sp.]
MTITRRSTLEFASGLAVLGGSPVAAFAGTGIVSPAPSGPHTAQSFLQLVVHRDETDGVPHHAMLSIASPDTLWVAINTLDAAGYKNAAEKYRLRGYRLRRLDGFQTASGPRYAAIWQYANGPAQQAQPGMTQAEFEQRSARLEQQGYRLAYVDGSGSSSGPTYCAIWEKRTAVQDAGAMLTAADYERKLSAQAAQGFRPRGISGYAVDGQSRFAAIFEKSAGPAWVADHRMTAQGFKTKNAALLAQGYSLTDVSGHAIGKQPVFSGIWEKV